MDVYALDFSCCIMGVLYAIVFPSSVKTVFPSMPWCFLLNGDMVFLILLSMTYAFRLKLFLGYSIFKLVYFFKPGQFISTLISFGQERTQVTGHKSPVIA